MDIREEIDKIRDDIKLTKILNTNINCVSIK